MQNAGWDPDLNKSTGFKKTGGTIKEAWIFNWVLDDTNKLLLISIRYDNSIGVFLMYLFLRNILLIGEITQCRIRFKIFQPKKKAWGVWDKIGNISGIVEAA